MEALADQKCAYCGADSNASQYCCQGCESLARNLSNVSEQTSKNSYLDLPNFKKQYLSTTGPFDYQIYVEGLHCASCVHLLERLPEFIQQIKVARVDFSASLLSIQVEPSFSLAQLMDLLSSWGYRAQFLSGDEDSKFKLLEESKSLLKKLAVTGACAGNIMLFVIPVYSGLEGPLKTIFNWMGFVLFLPIIFYSGVPFYQGAWNSLRYQKMNVDLPIAIALLSGFLLSTVNLIRGNGDIYFDSTASFIFLILCARYYLKRSQQKFLEAQPLGNEITKDQYTVLGNGASRIASALDIESGHVLRLKTGQTCPVDGVLQSSGLIDLAVLNGEPLARRFEEGMSIFAGSKILSFSMDVLVTTPYRSTTLSLLLKKIHSQHFEKSNFVSITDKVSQWLVWIVSALALAYFIFHFQTNFQEAYNRALALVVLACPCALAFGTPLAFNLALRKAREIGFLIKDAGALEKLWRVRNVFFDKTGTLTSLDLKVLGTEPREIPSNLKTLILGLERSSYHPVAFALREAWATYEPAVLTSVEEKIGVGVSGTFHGIRYDLVQDKSLQSTGDISVALLENGKKICSIQFEAPLIRNAKEMIQNLRSFGVNIFLASGDVEAKALSVGLRCEIPQNQIFGGLSPDEKKKLILSHQPCCMVGDGSNDALALRAADVGIAVKGSTYVNFQAADIYLTHEGLEPLLNLFILAHDTRKVLMRNLIFALFYNFIGGSLALAGYVDPWLAAILMPVSSFLIISSTLWGFR